MTKRERDVMKYVVHYIRNGFDGRRMASTAVDPLTATDRKEIREYTDKMLKGKVAV